MQEAHVAKKEKDDAIYRLEQVRQWFVAHFWLVVIADK